MYRMIVVKVYLIGTSKNTTIGGKASMGMASTLP